MIKRSQGLRVGNRVMPPRNLPDPVAAEYSPYYLELRKCNESIEREPLKPDAYISRAFLHMRYNEFPNEQLEDLNKAIELRPDAAIIYRLRAQVYTSMKNIHKASADLAKVRKLEAEAQRRADMERNK